MIFYTEIENLKITAEGGTNQNVQRDNDNSVQLSVM